MVSLKSILLLMTFQQQLDLEEIFKWNFDLSNTYGKTLSIIIWKHIKLTLRENSTEFDAGGLGFLKTQPILMCRKFDKLNVAFGSEIWKLQNQCRQPVAYQYDINGGVVSGLPAK
jgi:hypothetical protein